MRLIDADALIAESANYRCGLYGVRREAVEKFAEYIKNAPTIDAEPVRHGKWIFKQHDFTQSVECPACGWKTDRVSAVLWMRYPGHRFCGHCGAKMDAGGS